MHADRAHLNLVESSQRLFELDPDATVETGPGWFLGAGSPAHPIVSNAAFRTDAELDAEAFLARARDFFGERGRGFCIWVRHDIPEDRDLSSAAESTGLRVVHAMPEMILEAPVEAPPLPAGVELRKLRSGDEADDYWRVAASSYTSLGFPPEVFGFNTNHSGLLADDVAAYIAYLDGKPVSIAMTIVSHYVAGIYWVGSLEEARGMGLGRAVTTAATNAGFELGAEIASLQASPMGEPIYAEMGYETIFDYQLLLSPPP